MEREEDKELASIKEELNKRKEKLEQLAQKAAELREIQREEEEQKNLRKEQLSTEYKRLQDMKDQEVKEIKEQVKQAMNEMEAFFHLKRVSFEDEVFKKKIELTDKLNKETSEKLWDERVKGLKGRIRLIKKLV